MGLWGSIVDFVKDKIEDKVEDVALDATLYAVGTVQEKVDNHNEKKVKKFIEKKDDRVRLILSQKRYKAKETYDVYDENKQVKYIVKGKLFSIKHNLKVFNATGKEEIAYVKEKMFALRNPLAFYKEEHPINLEIGIGGKKVATIKSKWSYLKPKFQVDYNGWEITGDILGLKFSVMEGNVLIMSTQEKRFYADDVFMLEINKKENELMGLLVALAIDSSLTSKASDVATAHRHNKLI